MHAFRQGVVENVTKLVLSKVPASKKAAFDNLGIAFCKSHRQTFVKHIQRHVGAIALQISQISPQTNILVLFFVCGTISIQ